MSNEECEAKIERQVNAICPNRHKESQVIVQAWLDLALKWAKQNGRELLEVQIEAKMLRLKSNTFAE